MGPWGFSSCHELLVERPVSKSTLNKAGTTTIYCGMLRKFRPWTMCVTHLCFSMVEQKYVVSQAIRTSTFIFGLQAEATDGAEEADEDPSLWDGIDDAAALQQSVSGASAKSKAKKQ